MISLIVTLLLVCILVYVIQLLLSMLALPEQSKQIANIILAVVVVLWLLSYFKLYSYAQDLDVQRYQDKDNVVWWTNGGLSKEDANNDVYKFVSEDKDNIYLGFIDGQISK